MKNTITINTNGKFEVECVDMVDSGSNFIFLNVITGENPESLAIFLNDNLITTFSGLISASENLFLLPEDCYVADTLLKVKYGSDYSIVFSFPSSIIGNMTVEKVSDLSYSVKYSYSQSNLMLQCYPIGSIYMSVNNINPSKLFGGVWEAWGTGKTIIGVDANDTDFNSVEKTGGEKTHTLTAAETPKHRHSFTPKGTVSTTTDLTGKFWNMAIQEKTVGMSGNGIFKGSTKDAASYPTAGVYTSDVNDAISIDANHNHTFTGTAGNTGYIGSSGAHNNLQPYITCYMWKRTA